MDHTEIKQCLASLRDEQSDALLYDAIAAAEKDPHLAEIYRRFAAVERRHADHWAARLREGGVAVKPFRPAWRTRVLKFLARRMGPGVVLQAMGKAEQKAAASYGAGSGADNSPVAPAAMRQDESSHARILSQILKTTQGGLAGGQLAQLEGRHKSGGGNALRAAVLGANDGLVSNLSLIMGVAGAELGGGNSILIAGFAGLLAGACSMALGEWLSVQSSRELYQRQIAVEKAEIAAAPQEEAEELSLIYQARGLPKQRADELAGHIMSDADAALETLTREELGIDPDELGGSAWVAAGTSFALFAVGAIIPVIAFLFLKGQSAIITSAAASAVGLFIIGAATSLFTGRSTAWSGMRMVLFGMAAAAITFGIGRAIGVSIS